ncbi:MAG: A/G-specific adenine glycosylase [Gammaproteobacteria bacterium]
MDNFTRRILKWFQENGRHDLPWQQDPSPYRVWVSEIMLQQTQVATVVPYFKRFIKRFPDIETLAQSSIDDVLNQWTGLGYYARGRNLHRTAQIICDTYQGQFPEDIEVLIALPGIGRSTAGAILSLACKQRHPILDGNVKRVLTRFHAIEGWPGSTKVEQQLWLLADKHTPFEKVDQYTQAIMDLGATVCTRKATHCESCPVKSGCTAKRQDRQNDYPTPRQKRSLPVRKTAFVIVENHDGEILLEQRPPSGIWGGLWGFPECSPKDDIHAWVKKQLGLTANTIHYKPKLRHTFSHFHLDIVPVHIQAHNIDNRVNDSARFCWFTPDTYNVVGLATPVKRILDEITYVTVEEGIDEQNGSLRKIG